MVIRKEEVQFEAGDEVLSGQFIVPDRDVIRPQLLFLHGAGRATKKRAFPLAAQLAENYGVASFTFDFSGHGGSTGTLKTSSLKKRVQEASAALSYASFTEPISLCGFSMGAHIALELLKENSVRSLILFYPAVYASEVLELPFGDPRFTATIRREKSWESADVLEHLSRFEGNLLIVAGEKDKVIPPEIIELLMNSSPKAANRQLFVLPEAPHLLLPSLYKSKNDFEHLCQVISQFVIESRHVSHEL